MTTTTAQREADERVLFIAHQRKKDSIPEYVDDVTIMKGGITQHEWAGWQARAAIDQSSRPVAPEAPDPDGERYRWLAGGWTTEELAEAEAKGEQPADKPQLAVINHLALWYLSKDQVDHAIDTAMSRTNTTGGSDA